MYDRIKYNREQINMLLGIGQSKFGYVKYQDSLLVKWAVRVAWTLKLGCRADYTLTFSISMERPYNNFVSKSLMLLECIPY